MSSLEDPFYLLRKGENDWFFDYGHAKGI